MQNLGAPGLLTWRFLGIKRRLSRWLASGFEFGVGGPRKGMPVARTGEDNALQTHPLH